MCRVKLQQLGITDKMNMTTRPPITQFVPDPCRDCIQRLNGDDAPASAGWADADRIRKNVARPSPEPPPVNKGMVMAGAMTGAANHVRSTVEAGYNATT